MRFLRNEFLTAIFPFLNVNRSQPSTSALEPSGMVATKVHWVTPRSPRDEVVRVGPLTVGERLQDLREALVPCAVDVWAER